MKADPDILAWLQTLEGIARGAAANADRTSANAFVQNGNAFGTTAVLGTTDNQALTIQTDGGVANLIQLGATGKGIGIGTAAVAGAGRVDIGAAAQFTLSGGANSSISTSAGQLTLDAASVVTVGNVTATAVTIGHGNINTTVSGNGAPGGSFTQTFPLTAINNTSGNTNGGIAIQAGSNGGTGAIFIDMRRTDGTQVGNINQSGAAAMTYASGSDARLKTAIRPAHDAMNHVHTVEKIDVVHYTWKDDPEAKTVHGVIAQNIGEVYPDAFVRGQEEPDEDGRVTTPHSVDYGRMVPLLLGAIQELSAELKAVKAELAKVSAKK